MKTNTFVLACIALLMVCASQSRGQYGNDNSITAESTTTLLGDVQTTYKDKSGSIVAKSTTSKDILGNVRTTITDVYGKQLGSVEVSTDILGNKTTVVKDPTGTVLERSTDTPTLFPDTSSLYTAPQSTAKKTPSYTQTPKKKSQWWDTNESGSTAPLANTLLSDSTGAEPEKSNDELLNPYSGLFDTDRSPSPPKASPYQPTRERESSYSSFNSIGGAKISGSSDPIGNSTYHSYRSSDGTSVRGYSDTIGNSTYHSLRDSEGGTTRGSSDTVGGSTYHSLRNSDGDRTSGYSDRIGNSTYHTFRDSNGRSVTGYSETIGGRTYHSFKDSEGNKINGWSDD